MLPFTIQFQDGVPVSDQLVQAARKAILTEQLAAGDIFPSVRALSQELKISPTTAHKVVSQLQDAGFLVSRPGIGMVVTAPKTPPRDERVEHLKPLCEDLLREAAELNLTLNDTLEAVRRTAKETKLP
ncbi:MAG: GntR family transcriptional regulator [Verrucomicrobia bacterium]|nr:GntR family transcriptional regulator [Verrucomicrobiota bacterium]